MIQILNIIVYYICLKYKMGLPKNKSDKIMSELINNSAKRKELLKHLILQLHSGEAPDAIRKRLEEYLKTVPYNEVVEVEQELIS